MENGVFCYSSLLIEYLLGIVVNLNMLSLPAAASAFK